MYRDKTRVIQIGGRKIGGGNPVLIQSMTNTKTEDADATVSQILELEKAGCDIVRCAVPTPEAAEAIGTIRERIHIPLVADIHFDYRLAIQSIEAGADKVRINPGNIGSHDRVYQVIEKAREHKIPVRIGINSGSLEKEILEKYGAVCPEALCESAMRNVRLIEEMDFQDIVVSIKASDVLQCVEANRLAAKECIYPLHIGITESGTVFSGSIKSSIGLGLLLNEGIGDTIRVSLTGDPVCEVRTAAEILRTFGLRNKGAELVSCPTCGRTKIDLISLAEQAGELIARYDLDGIKVAVMGCVVNGPGEAREADIGIAGGDGEGLLFRKGEIIKKVPESELLSALKEELDNWQGRS
ncbi:MAG: flavodoxin-dependent (E)-4-hydroxy-3-methylbut-2-enyl-diphosphate synthase [Lachnospiraceae bacterium]|nr:flavodoxin-dependent (E)-4-hydroxy-3-methylbut-2-enyl-diphosphate synthase [Lachnospiraceae bacterium]